MSRCDINELRTKAIKVMYNRFIKHAISYEEYLVFIENARAGKYDKAICSMKL